MAKSLVRHFALASSAALALGVSPTFAAQQNTAIETRGDGLAIYDFNTNAGRVRVYLPDDMAAGDTISGTVTEAPAGQTDAERQMNAGVLSGYVVETPAGPVQRAQNDRPHFHLVTPVVVGMTSLILRNGAGQIVGQVAVPVAPPAPPPPTVTVPAPTAPTGNPPQNSNTGSTPPDTITVTSEAPPINNTQVDFGRAAQPGPPDDVGAAGQPGGARAPGQPPIVITNVRPDTQPLTPRLGQFRQPLTGVTQGPVNPVAPLNFVMASIAQAGRPLEIAGPFDGNSSNTTVQIADTSVRVLAESPRKAVFESPARPGMTNIAVTESGQQATGQYRNVGVQLTAPKTNLLRGEQTELRVQVSGLEGLTEPVPLTLQSSGPIQTQGGNLQSVSVTPAEVNAQGVYTTTRAITGQQAGAFTVTASLRGPAGAIQEDPLFPGAFDMNGIESAKELLALVSSMNDDERTRRLCATVRALRERIAGATGGTRDWLNSKLTMVLSVNETLGIDCP